MRPILVLFLAVAACGPARPTLQGGDIATGGAPDFVAYAQLHDARQDLRTAPDPDAALRARAAQLHNRAQALRAYGGLSPQLRARLREGIDSSALR